jgi:hypothetical protein
MQSNFTLAVVKPTFFYICIHLAPIYMFKKSLLYSPILLILLSCSSKEECADCIRCGEDLNVKELTIEEAIVEAKNPNKTLVDSADLKESIAKIEEKYGEQWDFCHCVVINDSIDKAIKGGDSSDKLMARWDVVDKKCQVFRIQDPNRTPEQRDAHERRVKKCLKEAGIRK